MAVLPDKARFNGALMGLIIGMWESCGMENGTVRVFICTPTVIAMRVNVAMGGLMALVSFGREISTSPAIGQMAALGTGMLAFRWGDRLPSVRSRRPDS